MNRLPYELVINHIIPYTYHFQSDDLMRDIKTFHFTLHEIYKLYKEKCEQNPVYKEQIYEIITPNVVHFCRNNDICSGKIKKFLYKNYYKEFVRIIIANMSRTMRLKFLFSKHYIYI